MGNCLKSDEAHVPGDEGQVSRPTEEGMIEKKETKSQPKK